MDPLSTVVEILLVAFAIAFFWLAWTEGRPARQGRRVPEVSPSSADMGQMRRPLIPHTIRQTPLA